jgi:hypothetical protein
MEKNKNGFLPEYPVQMQHLPQVVLSVVERGQAHRHHPHHGEVLPLQVLRQGVQVDGCYGVNFNRY